MTNYVQAFGSDSEGYMIGAATTALVGFHGTAPCVQAAAITAPAATAATNSSPYGFAQVQADAIVTAVRAMITALKNKGITA